MSEKERTLRQRLCCFVITSELGEKREKNIQQYLKLSLVMEEEDGKYEDGGKRKEQM
jgi:hypothetical protein